MRTVTWVLRILSIITFVIMCWTIYRLLSGYWEWDIPYVFIVTVFRMLSLLIFFASIMIVNGLAAPFLGGAALNELLSGVYNTLILRLWYLQPYGVEGPVTDVFQVFASFSTEFTSILYVLYEELFTFLYFLCAAVGVALFLQSLVRMEQKFVGGAFISIQLILVVAAFRGVAIYNFDVFPTDFLVFLMSSLQVLVLVSFAYLEIGYQMIYSHSVGKPIEDREENLKKQLLALRTATRREDAIERGDKVRSSVMSRISGATVFSFLRETIERKVLGSKGGVENLDAVSDVRRLQIYIDELLSSDPNASEELTAKAAAPSEKYVITSTITGSLLRIIAVVPISFVLLNPSFLLGLLSYPAGIESSIELNQPEIIMLYIVPILLLFPLTAMVIRVFSGRESEPEPTLSKEEKAEVKKRKKELQRKKKEAAEARRTREQARQKRSPEEKDEWDRALEETIKH